MGLHLTWYAFAVVGAYRTITVCFEAVVRHALRIAAQDRSTAPAGTPARRPAAGSGRPLGPHALTLYQDLAQAAHQDSEADR
ncbi:hypothetical protein ACGFW5_06310 [Streptomyces sp. NPDC048416]|uniref:hypothetical protein n=1 Tax=Streptomyces sp. NPDC048416 TaxID=3365546 RepID=UPI003711980F